MPIRVGLFGAGWAAQTVHGPSLEDYRRKRRGIVLAGICDLDRKKADQVRRAFNFEGAWDSPQKMLREAGLDAAVVAVSPEANARVARLCVRAGLPTLLEKPPAGSRSAVVSLARSVEQSGGRKQLVQVAFNRRWTPSLVGLKKIMEKVRARPIRSLSVQMRRVARCDPDFSTTAIHAIDCLRFLADADYRSLSFLYSAGGPRGEVTDYRVQGEMANGAVVQMEFSPMAGVMMERYTVEAGGMTFVAHYGRDETGTRVQAWSSGKRREFKVRVPGSAMHQIGGFYQQMVAFLDAVRSGGRLPRPTVADSIQTVAVMEALSGRRRQFRAR